MLLPGTSDHQLVAGKYQGEEEVGGRGVGPGDRRQVE